jgi:hypothetical protein
MAISTITGKNPDDIIAAADWNELVDNSNAFGRVFTGMATNYVATDESTSSTSYVALTTAQSVTVTVPASGKVILIISVGNIVQASATGTSVVTFIGTGSNTFSATASNGFRKRMDSGGITSGCVVRPLSGLSSGSTTFSLRFLTSAGTTTFGSRGLIAIPWEQ